MAQASHATRRRRLTTQANAYPSHFPTETLCVPITHTQRAGEGHSALSRECSNSRELNSRNAPSWPSQGLIRDAVATPGNHTQLEGISPRSNMSGSCSPTLSLRLGIIRSWGASHPARMCLVHAHALHSASARACTAFPKRLRSLMGSLYIHMRNLRDVLVHCLSEDDKMSAIISLVETVVNRTVVTCVDLDPGRVEKRARYSNTASPSV
jgi:hypothetical protein